MSLPVRPIRLTLHCTAALAAGSLRKRCPFAPPGASLGQTCSKEPAHG